MSRIILFNKPYGVICQFTPVVGYQSLQDFIPFPDFYPAGRLDADSEGLVLLTDNGKLQNRICSPKFKLNKTYWVQVEGKPDDIALNALRRGVVLKDFKTQPSQVNLMDEPSILWQRIPPIRYRKSIPTTWLTLTLREGKNRQIRRMTAAVFFPTLRLIRYAIGLHTLQGILPGEWRMVADPDLD
ncbi:pseudouridine synthase [Nitrosomonas supralitoralis]|uniref:Pseudouridine synthase n=1 Tax=Nitrosomonas supralitoralis TaxID=2116706 RepID=A0A2P7NS75_9PROT|nr:pseudouridine synthase [Nitrosomonas supralitoralis]PSJ16324.1 23S rRNA pseudouridylate synthase [Nitrosomonas supralitoralis]